MAKETGRNLIIQKNNVTIASCRSKSFKWNGEPVDVTDDDNAGVRELLSSFGTESIELSVEGVANTATLRDIAMTRATTKMLTDITVDRVGGTMSLSGNFLLVSYEEKATSDGPIEFSATLQSSGNWSFTA